MLFLPALAFAAVAPSDSGFDWRRKLEPLFDASCYNCHDASEAAGSLDLDALRWSPDDAANLRRWIQIYDKVGRGEMPPKSKPRPPAAAVRDLLDTLGAQLSSHSALKQATEGRVTYRRLNRAEYENTLHDILGIDTPLAELLPEDGKADGFDNVGAALNLSATHLERYLRAAQIALMAATTTTPRRPSITVRTDYNETWMGWNHPFFQRNMWTHGPDGVLALRYGGGFEGHGELGSWAPPVPDARYRFRIRARALIDRDGPNAVKRDRPDRRIMLKVGLAGWPRNAFTSDHHFFELSPDAYREIIFEARVPKGKTLYLAPYRAVPEVPGERAMVAGLAASVEWVEIEGPLEDSWPSAGHRLLYGELPFERVGQGPPESNLRIVFAQPEADARPLLARFLGLAFRRPASSAEIDEHMALFREQIAKHRPFDEALRTAYSMALCSPSFLFLRESPGPLDDFALAARLSYGLWCSTPDEELRQLASAGRLRDSGTLRAQTRRLLASPKSNRFVRSFLGNWLRLSEIDFTQPDTRLHPEFEEYLQQSMVAESEAFFTELMADNLPARNIVHSEFAMLNERLAEHYEIAGVRGPGIRRVALPPDSQRGGFLTQGAVLKVSANGTTTSPVVRGVYVLENILARPPDPPPPNVSVIEPDIRGATTVRDQLARHRDQAACASCHARIDPPGFALEAFDVTGRWREYYRVMPASARDLIVKVPGSDLRHYVDGARVDSSYVLADGRAFANISELKQLLLSEPALIAHAFTEKLMIHLTGGLVQFADRAVVDAIVKETAPNQHGVRSILEAIIVSPVFLNK